MAQAEIAKTPFLQTNIGKTLKAGAYIAVSAAIGSIIAALTKDPVLFGVYTPIINFVLVFVQKTFFDKKTTNV